MLHDFIILAIGAWIGYFLCGLLHMTGGEDDV